MNIRNTEVLDPFLESPGCRHKCNSFKKLILSTFFGQYCIFKIKIGSEMEFIELAFYYHWLNLPFINQFWYILLEKLWVGHNWWLLVLRA